MKTLTFIIADRLDELAGEWYNHTPQCEALMMAAKEVATFEQEEKDRMVDFAYKYGNLTLQQISDAFDNEYNNENLNTNEKLNNTAEKIAYWRKEEDALNRRMNIVGQNGNTGEHYEEH